MEDKLEQLLNMLIQRGWKPFGINYYEYENWCLYYSVHTEDGVWSEWRYWVSLRELVSKESWLWQFVCENKMVKEWWYVNGWCYHNDYDEYDNWDWNDYDKELKRFYDTNYQYRLIESALKDEPELGQLLLDNINV